MGFWKTVFTLGIDSVKKTSALRARKQMFQRLGELSYALYKSSQIDNEAMEIIVKEIDELNEEIKKYDVS